MSSPARVPILFVSLLGVFVLTSATDPGGERGSRGSSGGTHSSGGGGGHVSAGSAFRSSGGSSGFRGAPAPASYSRSSDGGRGSAPAPSQGRGSAPAPAPSPAPAPRGYEGPRYQPPSPPPSSGPSSDGPRYLPPDNANPGRAYGGARTYDSARNQPVSPGPVSSSGRESSGNPGSAGLSSSGLAGARLAERPETRDADNRVPDNRAFGGRETSDDGNGRVWQPPAVIDLSNAGRPQRPSVPALTGARPGLSASRLGNVDRGLRDAYPGSGRRSESPVGSGASGSLRDAGPSITRESILQRYRGVGVLDNARGAPAGRESGANDLSRARASGNGARDIGTQPSGKPPMNDRSGSGKSGQRPASGGKALTRAETAERQKVAVDQIQRLQKTQPAVARSVTAAGEALGRVSAITTQITVGASFGSNCCTGHSNCGNGSHGGWWWNGWCGTPFWWWGSCSWGWPWWGSCFGFGFWSHNWGFYWGGYPYYSYPYYAYYPSPVYYSSVVYDSYSNYDAGYSSGYNAGYGAGSQAGYSAPVAAGEASVGVPAEAKGYGGAPPKAAPEVQESMGRAASEFLALGDEAFRQGRYGDAVHHYARAVEYTPEQGVLYLLLSDALFATGDYHYCAFALRRALELEPKLLDNIIDKHPFYGVPAEYDKQIELAERYLGEHVLDDDARLVLAANYLFAKRPAQCVDLLTSSFSKSLLESHESNAARLLLNRAEEIRQVQPAVK